MKKIQEQVRVLRVVEYVGDRSAVEECVARSLHGEMRLPNTSKGSYTIRAATIGNYPELLVPISAPINQVFPKTLAYDLERADDGNF